MKKLKKVYLTHCSAKKDTSLKDNSKKIQPINLYTATPIQRFMKKCQSVDVNWAVFSDKYGIWHSSVRHQWYEKNPNSVSDDEFVKLLNNFDKSLSKYDEIWFYYNPGRFHKFKKRMQVHNRLCEDFCYSYIYKLSKLISFISSVLAK